MKALESFLILISVLTYALACSLLAVIMIIGSRTLHLLLFLILLLACLYYGG